MKKKLSILLALFIMALAGVFYYFKESQLANQPLVLYGNVDIRVVDLAPRIMGRIQTLFFEEGADIKPGELLATIDAQPYQNEQKKAQAKLRAVKIHLDHAKSLYERRKELLRNHSISQEDHDNTLNAYNALLANVEEAEAGLAIANTALQDTQIFSPSAGVILTRIREPGTVVNIGEPIYTLSLREPVWIRAYIKETDLGNIYPGIEAQITNDSGGKYIGHVGYISPLAEFTPKSVETTDLRTDLVYRLRIIIEHNDQGLRQGMPVTVTIRTKQERT